MININDFPNAKIDDCLLINGDCLEVMDKIIEQNIKVDAIITDPPYRVISGGNEKGLSYRHKGSIIEANDGKIFKYNDICFSDWLPKVYQTLKDDSHCYIMTNFLNLKELMIECDRVGFKAHNLLIWEKQNSTPNRWYMKNCEYILFLRKGKAKPINNMGSKTVHKFENPFGNKQHPTEKSIGNMEFYIKNSSNQADIIFDPFMGSATTGIACQNTNRKFIGIELEEKYYNIGIERITNNRKRDGDND